MTTAWTPQERSRAIQWRNHGRTAEFIAKRLGKPVENVEAVLDMARRSAKKAVEPRKCLKCRGAFSPRHEGLFLCDHCKASNAELAPCAWPMGNGEGLFLCDHCKASNAALAPCAWPMGNGASLAGRRSK